MSVLPVMRLDHAAKMPIYASIGAAGMDLSANLGWGQSLVLYPTKRYTVPTGLAFAVPDGCYLRIAPRGGLAAKSGIDVLAGVVDSDYRGEVLVILLNTGDEQVRIGHGDRIAQAILEIIGHPAIHEVFELPSTERGAGRFGSTGA